MKPWNKYMKATAPSIHNNTFVDLEGKEIDASKFIHVVAYGNNFEPKIQHGNLLFVNPFFEDSDITNERVVLDNDLILWYVDRESNKLYRKDNREKELNIKELKGYVKYVYDLGNKIKFED